MRDPWVRAKENALQSVGQLHCSGDQDVTLHTFRFQTFALCFTIDSILYCTALPQSELDDLTRDLEPVHS